MNQVITCILALLTALNLSGCTAVQPPVAQQVSGTMEVHFIDVGQADSELIQCGDKAMLIDGGNVADSSLVVSYLSAQKIDHLDYVVCTHAHEDHVGGLSGPLNKFKVDHVLAPVTNYDSDAFRNFAKYTAAQGLDITVPSVGDNFSLGDASVEVMGPQKLYDETNNTSIVLKVTYGETSFLFPGDAERESEQDMLDAGCDLNATVLKVGHHGSDTSTTYPFLRAVAPSYAVISVGADNSYGHPAESTLSRLRDAEVTVYRTDLQGNIVAVSNGKQISFTTQKGKDVQTNPTESKTEITYIGNINSHVFHRDTCDALPAEKNQVWFESREAAIAAGYKACTRCKP